MATVIISGSLTDLRADLRRHFSSSPYDLNARRFDLYMLDSRLPDVDGFELCRRLRAIDPDTPILFFSGAAYEADKKKGIEAGANAYVIKPDLDGLVTSIQQFASQAERPRAKIIPFVRKTSGSSPFPFEPAAA